MCLPDFKFAFWLAPHKVIICGSGRWWGVYNPGAGLEGGGGRQVFLDMQPWHAVLMVLLELKAPLPSPKRLLGTFSFHSFISALKTND